AHRRLALPPYPFEREYYWFESKLTYAKLSTLLTQSLFESVLQLPSGSKLYSGKISRHRYPYLSDHVIFDQVILPGAMYVQLALETQEDKAKEQGYFIEDMVFEYPLIMSSTDSIVLQMLVNDSSQFEVYSILNDKSAVRHCYGRFIESVVFKRKPLDVNQYKKQARSVISSKAYYEFLSDNHFHYGLSFQGVHAVYQHENYILAEVNLKADGTYIAHPALLDSCMQVIGALSWKDADQFKTYIPSGIKAIQLLRALPAQLWVFLLPVELEKKEVSFQLYDLSGEFLGLIDGVQLSAFNYQQLGQGNGSSIDRYYELIWTPVCRLLPMEKPPVNTKELTAWLLISNQKTELTALAKELIPWGIELHTRCWNEINNLDILKEIHVSRILYGVFEEKELSSWLVENTESICIVFLEFLQQLIKHLESMSYWIPLDIITSSCGPASSLWGMGRALQNEYSDWLVSLFDSDEGLEGSLLARVRLLHDLAGHADNQFQIKNNEVYTCRLKHSHLPADARQIQQQLAKMPYRLVANEQGLLSSFNVEPVKKTVLQQHEIELSIEAVGLNFRDVLLAMHLYPDSTRYLGSDFSGVVKKVGSSVVEYAPGDRVLGLSYGALATDLVVEDSQIVKIPELLSFEQAAILPTVFMTVLHALQDVAQLQQGEKILIHSASGGVGLAAIAYARLVGAQIYVTAGDARKRAYLKEAGLNSVYDSRSLGYGEQLLEDTQGLGVDVVLNTLTGPGFIETSLGCCAKGARFIELSKRDIWTAQQVANKRQDVEYHLIALDELLANNPKQTVSLLNRVLAWVQDPSFSWIPYTTYPMTQVVQAFHHLQQAQHIGKVVLVAQSVIATEDVYLITGGLSGIGYALCEWLIDQGAKNIALLSRRKASTAQLKQLDLWKACGVRVNFYSVDVGDKQALEQAYYEIQSDLGLIKYVFHAAGVLSDALLKNQTAASVKKVFRGKVFGAWYLHELTQHNELKQFVVFSSIATILAPVGQSSYAAANLFLEKLIEYRQACDLPGLCVHWGPWRDVGMARSYSHQFPCLNNQEAFFSLHYLLSHTQTRSAYVLSANWTHYFHNKSNIPALFSDLFLRNEAKQSGNLFFQLKQESESKAGDLLSRALNQLIGILLDHPKDYHLDPN
ncbi:MAG: hypothetical protein CK426_09345, partial [Legionella sp.]